MEQSGFATTTGSGNGNEFAWLHIQVDSSQCVDWLVALSIHLGYVFDLEHGIDHISTTINYPSRAAEPMAKRIGQATDSPQIEVT